MCVLPSEIECDLAIQGWGSSHDPPLPAIIKARGPEAVCFHLDSEFRVTSEFSLFPNRVSHLGLGDHRGQSALGGVASRVQAVSHLPWTPELMR